jgi:hypothetical protein
VFIDLMTFITFYAILCVLLSLNFGVLSLANPNIPGKYYDEFVKSGDEAALAKELAINGGNRLPIAGGGGIQQTSDIPYGEYYFLSLSISNIITMVRLSFGDFSLFGTVEYIDNNYEHWLFWITWFLALMIANIVFLNFIVAEASASYTNVNENLEAYIEFQKASLVAEA